MAIVVQYIHVKGTITSPSTVTATAPIIEKKQYLKIVLHLLIT